MCQKVNSIIYENNLSLRDTERLFLDAESADVFFVFNRTDQECELVPGHKSVLSIISPVFDSIFYGPAAKDGDINIDDASPEVFKEFLQFFYVSAVRLTIRNYLNVMNLVRKYKLEECVDSCREVCELSLTVDNMCWGYKLAILFNNEDLERFCEEFICKNPYRIFRSSSFLNCERNVLRCILQFDAMNCDESVIFDGCMAWAKAACIRCGIDDTNAGNIRNVLGDSFYEIRFGEMAIKDFYDRYCNYKGLFSVDEFEDIVSMIALKNHQSAKFNQISRRWKSMMLNGLSDMISDRVSLQRIVRRDVITF